MRPYAVITPMPHLSTILLVPKQTLSRERLTVECPTGRVIASVFAEFQFGVQFTLPD